MEYEKTTKMVSTPETLLCLNPCFNGIRKNSLQINKLKNYCFKNFTNIVK